MVSKRDPIRGGQISAAEAFSQTYPDKSEEQLIAVRGGKKRGVGDCVIHCARIRASEEREGGPKRSKALEHKLASPACRRLQAVNEPYH
ncbi:hypothetical protein EVAR_74894_1 [Eumeta japonica]|uniref:Uncharacterized protein n=1 Tax=Eumeta variegata TaxID=151549 RepID=A0A4C1Z330_EUMVA|nr:hypothetical protein EVAR_74894_1 [Eumeta japonica]